MKTKNAQFLSCILAIAGTTLLAMAVILRGYGYIDDYFAVRRAETLLKEVSVRILTELPTYEQHEGAQVQNPEDGTLVSEVVMHHETLGYSTIGIISIPILKVRLPVISECTDEFLKISACWYRGEISPMPSRMVISAHNYRNHFGRLHKLDPFDEVIFQANNGMTYTYRVTELLEIDQYDHDALFDGDWDMTLFTCTKDRVRRVLVRLKEKEYG